MKTLDSAGITQTFRYINKLRSKRILIFGGTSGFGYAVSQAAIENGADVIISGSNPERLSKTIDRLQSTYQEHIRPSQISTAICDLSELDTLSSRIESLLRHVTIDGTKRLDHIVYTADNAYPVPAFRDTTPNDISGSLQLRVYASTILSSVLSRTSGMYLNKASSSSLTFTNGISGHRPVPGWVVPAMAATAVEGLVRALAIELAPVRVNLVSAGPVKTELLAQLPEEYLKMYEEETLTKQLGSVEDVAESYLYVMKDGAVTGSVLATDGGRRIA